MHMCLALQNTPDFLPFNFCVLCLSGLYFKVIYKENCFRTFLYNFDFFVVKKNHDNQTRFNQSTFGYTKQKFQWNLTTNFVNLKIPVALILSFLKNKVWVVTNVHKMCAL